MTKLQERALAIVPLSMEKVDFIYNGVPSVAFHKELCESHERLRAELKGAEMLLAENEATKDDADKICQKSVEAFIRQHEENERAGRTQRIKASLERAQRIAGMPDQVVMAIQDLMANHEATGCAESIYARAAVTLEQVQTALEVTMESRAILIRDADATKLKLEVTLAKIKAFESIARDGFIEAWTDGNGFMATQRNEAVASALHSYQMSRLAKEVRDLVR